MTAAAARPEKEPGTAVAEQRPLTVRDLPTVIRTSKQAQKQLQAFLPDGVSLERVAASLDLALRKARAEWAEKRSKDSRLPALAPLERCEPASVLLAVAKIQQWGLEIGETAHLVPFGATCTAVADYKGLEELMVASGVARMVQSRCVYEKEPFKLVIGTTTELEHRPIATVSERGKMIGAYAIVHVRGGLQLVEYMSVEEIDAVRQQYSKQWKQGALTEWYARKTVVRRVAKHVPKNPRLAKILAEIDREEVMEVPAGLAATMVTAHLADEEPARVHQIGSGPAPLMSVPDDAYAPDAPAPAPAEDAGDASAPAICARCEQAHRFGEDQEDLGNADGSCFRFTAA